MRFIDLNYGEIKCSEKMIKENYSKLTLNECINIIQSFFDKYSINLDIEKLIKDGTIEFISEAKKDKFNGSLITGHSCFDENGKRKIYIFFDGTFESCLTLIHELLHYLNQPEDKRSFTNHLLTESISYGGELILLENLRGTIYEKDRNIYLNSFSYLLRRFSYYTYYVYKIILLYKRRHGINRTLYDEEFGDGEYEKTLEEFEKFVKEKKSIMKDTFYIICFPLSIYFLNEYSKDENFIYTLLKFSDSINKLDLWECLRLVGISDKKRFDV